MALTSFQGIGSLLVEANRPFVCHPSAARNVSPIRPGRTQCGLTPRSSGAPTAGHQARSGGTRYIFASPGLASCRRRPLNSNVRRRKGASAVDCAHYVEPEVNYTLECEREADGRWLAEVLELPGVMAYGASQEQAMARAEALALRVLAEQLEQGEAKALAFSIALPAAA